MKNFKFTPSYSPPAYSDLFIVTMECREEDSMHMNYMLLALLEKGVS